MLFLFMVSNACRDAIRSQGLPTWLPLSVSRTFFADYIVSRQDPDAGLLAFEKGARNSVSYRAKPVGTFTVVCKG